MKIERKEGDALPSSLDYFQTLSERWTLTITFLSPCLHYTIFFYVRSYQSSYFSNSCTADNLLSICLHYSLIYFPLCCSYMTNWWSLVIPNTATFQSSSSLSSSSLRESRLSLLIFQLSVPSFSSLLK